MSNEEAIKCLKKNLFELNSLQHVISEICNQRTEIGKGDVIVPKVLRYSECIFHFS